MERKVRHEVVASAWCCFTQRGEVWQPSDALHSWLCVSSSLAAVQGAGAQCDRSSEPLCPARGICAGTTLAWDPAALLQPPCEITALFRILAPLNPNKGCNTSSVSGRNDKLIMSFKLQRLAPLQGITACLPYLSCPPERAWQAPPCSWICSRYRPWSLQALWAPFAVRG